MSHKHHEIRHGALQWIVLALVILTGLVWGLYYYLQKNNDADALESISVTTPRTSPKATPKVTPTNRPSATPDATAGWKTYSNSQYGFSFRYPSSWSLSTDKGTDNYPVVRLTSPDTARLINACKPESECISSDMQIYYSVSVAEDYGNVVNKLGATTLEELISEDKEFSKMGPITIGGSSGYDGTVAGLATYYTIYVTHDNHLYKIWFETAEGKDKVTPVENTILSTFQFTN